LTADTLSSESREGTLGLLFLTDLRSWDVTLGKLVSSGLGAVYVGFALVPVLMLPVLAGGVSAAESTRAGITLVAIILFGLTAGLAASAREYERDRALRRAGLWVGGTVLLPPIAGWFAAGAWFALLSPMTTLRLAQDTDYRAAPRMFWVSLTLQLIHAALLLMIAGARLRRQISEPAVAEAPSPAGSIEQSKTDYSVEPHSNASYVAVNSPMPGTAQPPGRFDESAPLEWLVRRQRGQRALCWIAAFTFLLPGFAFLLIQFFPVAGSGVLPIGFHALYQLSWVGDGLLAWAACRFFFDARRSGELELLLTTPAGAQTLVSAHWAAMRRLLLWPAIVVVTPLLLQGGFVALTTIGRGSAASYQFYSVFYAFFHACDLIVLGIAVNWLGMLFGLTMRRLISAVGLTLAFTVGLPMLFRPLLQMLTKLFFSPDPGSTGWMISMFSFYPIGWALLLALTFWARRRLRNGQPAELFRGRSDLLRYVPWAIANPSPATANSPSRT